MNVIAYYVVTKENLCREIADKTAELFLNGMSYEQALKKAKELYNYKDNRGKSESDKLGFWI